jgi:hypothetical protein
LLQNPELVQLTSEGHIKHLPAELPSPLKHVLVGFVGMPLVRTTQAGVAATLEELRADEETTAAADDELRTEEEETPAAMEEVPPPLTLEGVGVLTEL